MRITLWLKQVFNEKQLHKNTINWYKCLNTNYVSLGIYKWYYDQVWGRREKCSARCANTGVTSDLIKTLPYEAGKGKQQVLITGVRRMMKRATNRRQSWNCETLCRVGREGNIFQHRYCLSDGQNHNQFENNFWRQYGSQCKGRTRVRLNDMEI